MVQPDSLSSSASSSLSVLALSSRFDGPRDHIHHPDCKPTFQYSLCRVVLMVVDRARYIRKYGDAFSTRSVESF